MIRGAFEPELPDELVAVGRLLRAANGPMPGEDRAREADVLDAMLEAMKVVPITAARPVSSVRRRRRRVLVAITAAASVLGVSGVAAAAGSLPTPIQSFVHDTLDSVGVSVPDSIDGPAPTTSLDQSSDTDGDAPEPAGSAPATAGDEDSDNEKGQSGEAPGRTGETPGQSGESPGKSEEAPGQSGVNPGQSGNTPGQSGEAPGRSGTRRLNRLVHLVSPVRIRASPPKLRGS